MAGSLHLSGPRVTGAGSLAAALLLALALLLLRLTPAGAHGVMINPKSRNWKAYMENKFWYAHGLNMGGANVVSDGGRLRYPEGRRGICGDAYNEYRWDQPGPIQVTYVTGQVITIDVLVSVNHMGRMSVMICDLYSKPKDGKCKKLYLHAPELGYKSVKSWYFPGIHNWGGGNHGSEGPKYGDGTFSAYRLPDITDQSGWGCVNQRFCSTFKDMWVYRTQWKLPGSYKCDHCKLMWMWTTGHSCWPPCEKGNPMAQCKNTQPFRTCGEPGTPFPEEFQNCADVRIADNAKIDLSFQLPPWNGAVDLKSGQWGDVKPSRMNQGD